MSNRYSSTTPGQSYFLSPFLNTVSERATILSLVFAHQSDSYELLAVQGMTTGANDDYGNLGKTHIGEGVRAPRLYDSNQDERTGHLKFDRKTRELENETTDSPQGLVNVTHRADLY